MKKLLLLLLPVSLWGQSPDCSLPLNIPTGSTVPFNVGPFDNRTAGCTTWQITYNSTGFSALSIIVQTAPNNAGVPGSWSTFTPIAPSSNPNTATTQAVSTFGGATSYFPWLRVQLSSKTGTGTISGRLYGWRIPPEASVIIPSGTVCPAGTPCQVQNIGNGTVISGQQTVSASAVALATNTARNICVKALDGNTSAGVYIGPTGVTTSTGMELKAGQAWCGPVSNTNLIFVRAAAAVGDAVSWIATN